MTNSNKPDFPSFPDATKSGSKKMPENSGSLNRKSTRKTILAKRKKAKINQALILMVLIISIGTIIFFGYNIVRIATTKKSTGSGSTLTNTIATDSQKNDQYTIGNNPTSIEDSYFKELSTAVSSGDQIATATAVVKNFIVDYWTWTNKDGNYEVGGLQYIYGPKITAFESFSRYGFYSDLDLYISQYGRENLIQVKEVNAMEAAYTDDFVVNTVDPAVTLPCFYVEATWTYEKSSVDTSKFQQNGAFYVVNHDGRMEIIQFYGIEAEGGTE